MARVCSHNTPTSSSSHLHLYSWLQKSVGRQAGISVDEEHSILPSQQVSLEHPPDLLSLCVASLSGTAQHSAAHLTLSLRYINLSPCSERPPNIHPPRASLNHLASITPPCYHSSKYTRLETPPFVDLHHKRVTFPSNQHQQPFREPSRGGREPLRAFLRPVTAQERNRSALSPRSALVIDTLSLFST